MKNDEENRKLLNRYLIWMAKFIKNDYLVDAVFIRKCVSDIRKMLSVIEPTIVNKLCKEIKPLYGTLTTLVEGSGLSEVITINLLTELSDIIKKYWLLLVASDSDVGEQSQLLARERRFDSGDMDVFNSDEFYTKKIEKINEENSALVSRIQSLRHSVEQEAEKSGKAKEELERKERELQESIALIKKYEAEKLQNEKINDAKKEWNGRIIDAFENLKKYVEPIKNEHGRLKFLFWGYLVASIVIVLCLFVIEILICCKIGECIGLPTWDTYLWLIAPVPIALGMLWGFITLMHRVQRQLVILAKQIHEIEYVEGLLLTTNTLSTNINESMNKVNSAIEKLLENHLKYDGSTLTEELSLEKEEKKDAMPYEEVLKLIKGVAGVVSKNKE